MPPPKRIEMGHFTGFLGRRNYPQSYYTRPPPLALFISVSLVHATRTGLPLVGATARDDRWRWQVGNRSNSFGGIGSIRPRTEHGFVLPVRMLGPKLYDKCPSGTMPKPGKDAIVSRHRHNSHPVHIARRVRGHHASFFPTRPIHCHRVRGCGYHTHVRPSPCTAAHSTPPARRPRSVRGDAHPDRAGPRWCPRSGRQ